jgi:hypothetical protein
MSCFSHLLKHNSFGNVIIIIKITRKQCNNKSEIVGSRKMGLRAGKNLCTASLHPHNKGSHHGSLLLSAASKPW